MEIAIASTELASLFYHFLLAGTDIGTIQVLGWLTNSKFGNFEMLPKIAVVLREHLEIVNFLQFLATPLGTGSQTPATIVMSMLKVVPKVHF